MAAKTIYKRLNITLPQETVEVLNRLAPKGGRSHFVYKAVEYYVARKGKAAIRKQLTEGYQANAARDLRIAAEWFPLEEEAWQKRER